MHFSIGCNLYPSPFSLSFLTPAAEKSPEILFCRLNIIVTRPFPIQFSRSQQLCADSSHRVCKHPFPTIFHYLPSKTMTYFPQRKHFDLSKESLQLSICIQLNEIDELQMDSLTHSQVPSSITHCYSQLNKYPPLRLFHEFVTYCCLPLLRTEISSIII